MSQAIQKGNSENLAFTKKARVLDLLVKVCNYQTVIEKIFSLIQLKKSGYICVSTVHMVMESHDNKEFAKIVNSADLVIPDGMPLVWMQKLQGFSEATQVRGNSLMLKLLKFAEEKQLKVGFYGGKEKVIEDIQEKAKIDYPNLKISYAYSPPFRALTEQEDLEIVENINKSQVEILFVGLGCPKQEKWMLEHKDKIKSVMLGVGAAFDFYAGSVKESPVWMRKVGLEWLYRLTQEPKRLWRRYLILNPRFIWLATLQMLGLKKIK